MSFQTNFKPRLNRFLSISILIIAILIVGLSWGNRASAQPVGIVLSQSALPDDAVILANNSIEISEASHPLGGGKGNLAKKFSSLDEADRSALIDYQSVKVVSALVPSSGVIMNFSYQFNTRKSALAAARLLRNDMTKHSALTKIRKLNAGRGYMLKGDEGDYVYWFIGTKDNSLSLVMINGLDPKNISNLFESSVQSLTDQSVDPVSENE